MNERRKRRVARLEAMSEPALGIIVLQPEDPEPEDLPPGVHVIRIEYVSPQPELLDDAEREP